MIQTCTPHTSWKLSSKFPSCQSREESRTSRKICFYKIKKPTSGPEETQLLLALKPKGSVPCGGSGKGSAQCPLGTRTTPHQDANNKQQGKLPELFLRHPSAHAEATRAQHLEFSRSTDSAVQYTALQVWSEDPWWHNYLRNDSKPLSALLTLIGVHRGFQRLHSLCYHNRVNAEHLRTYLLLSWTLKITCKKVMQCKYIWVYYY